MQNAEIVGGGRGGGPAAAREADGSEGTRRRSARERRGAGEAEAPRSFAELAAADPAARAGKGAPHATGGGAVAGGAAGAPGGDGAGREEGVMVGKGEAGERFLAVSVDSPRLGPLHVEVVEQGGMARLRVAAASARACELVEARGAEIADLFARQGLVLERFSVGCGPGGGGERKEGGKAGAGEGGAGAGPGGEPVPEISRVDELIG